MWNIPKAIPCMSAGSTRASCMKRRRRHCGARRRERGGRRRHPQRLLPAPAQTAYLAVIHQNAYFSSLQTAGLAITKRAAAPENFGRRRSLFHIRTDLSAQKSCLFFIDRTQFQKAARSDGLLLENCKRGETTLCRTHSKSPWPRGCSSPVYRENSRSRSKLSALSKAASLEMETS